MAAETTLAVVSGGLLVVVGAALLAARPARAGGVSFGIFATLWGAEVVLNNLSRTVDDAGTAATLLRLGIALRIPQAMFLLHFATAFPRPERTRRASWPAWAATGIAAVAAAWFLLRPDDFLVSVFRGPAGTWSGRYGLANVLLVGVPSFGSFYFATTALARKYLEQRPQLELRELAVAFAALMLYVSHATFFYLLYFSLGWGTFAPAIGAPVTAGFLALFAVGAVVVVAVAMRLARRMKRGVAAEHRPADSAVLAAVVGPGLVGAAGAVPLAFGAAPVETIGAFRIAAAALLAYGILKHRLFGLDLGLKRAVRTTFPLLAAIAAEIVLGALAQDALSGVSLGGLPSLLVTGSVVAVGTAVFAVPFRQKAADLLFPHVREDEDYRRSRALEVYKAALAEHHAQGTTSTGELDALRERLGLTPRDADILRLVVRAELDRGVPPSAPADAGGRYRRSKLLSEKGLSRTWLAEDVTLGRKVVLKELAAPIAALTDVRAAGGITEPHVVVLHDVLAERASTTLVLEHVEGESLQDRLERDGRLPRPEALRVASDVLQGLAALHARGVVHRAVKPGNVLLARDGRAKVTDYGLATAGVGGADTRVALLEAVEPGTLRFASPELAAGDPTDVRSDVYSVGALLYRMVAGRFYAGFGTEDEYALRRKVQTERPRLPVEGEPDELNALLARALDKDPAARFATARDMLAAVQAVPGGAPTAVGARQRAEA